MSCGSTRYSGGESANVAWSNWAGRAGGNIGTWSEPASLPDLVNVVQRAEAANRQLRVIGSGWAFEDLAYSPDWVVSLKRLSQLLPRSGSPPGVVDTAINATWQARMQADPTLRIAHVEAGIRVADLSAQLRARRLELPTLGGANGQALAGVINTSTHGGDLAQPPFPDLVLAMHAVTVGGQEIWVERASDPLTVDFQLAQALACKDLEIIRDDDLFNAMCVGLGRFGIVYSYVLRVTPSFMLAEWTVQRPRATVMLLLRQGVSQGTFLRPLLSVLPDPPAALAASDPRNPRDIDVGFDTRNFDMCWIRRRWVATSTSDFQMVDAPVDLCASGAVGVLAMANPALTALSAITFPLNPPRAIAIDAERAKLNHALAQNPNMTAGDMMAQALTAALNLQADALVALLTTCILGGRYKESMNGGRRGRSDVIVSGFRSASDQTCYRADSVEPAFDAFQMGYLDFVEAIVASAPSVKQAGYLSLRWSAPSRALISQHHRATQNVVSVEVTSIRGMPDNAQWMTTLEALGIAYGGRPHWGQINALTAPTMTSLYGSDLQLWQTKLGQLTGNSRLFSCAFTMQRSLEPPASATTRTLKGRTLSEVLVLPIVTPTPGPTITGPVGPGRRPRPGPIP
jgi:FAD/FMN-containing dehydrogenase